MSRTILLFKIVVKLWLLHNNKNTRICFRNFPFQFVLHWDSKGGEVLKRFKIMSVPLSSFNIVTKHNLVWLILDVKINKIYNGDFRCAFIFKILISNI